MTDDQQELQAEREAYLIRFAIKWVAIILVSFFVVAGSCSMHSNSYDADRINAEAQLTEAKAGVEKERLATLERLVEGGADPQKVRCAMFGPNTEGDVGRRICEDLSNN